MAPRVSNATVAKHLGVSERFIYKVLREGTCDRSRARQLAVYFGGSEEKYLREPRPRGRPRKADPYSFQEFLSSNAAPEDWDEGWHLAADIQHMSRGSFNCESFSELIGLLQDRQNFQDDERLLAYELWERFRIWQADRAHEVRLFDIQVMRELD
jgi:hypothetical protein